MGCYLAEKRSETKEKPTSFLGGRGCYTSRVMEERRLEEEKARIEAEYREVLKNSVEFPKVSTSSLPRSVPCPSAGGPKR